LLSSHHFEKHLVWLARGACPVTAGEINGVLADANRLQAFHTATLNLFAAAYIAECRHTSHVDWMRDLDEKYRNLRLGEGGTDDAATSSVDAPNHVALVWQYRHACQA
jgi:hypothetical protein